MPVVERRKSIAVGVGGLEVSCDPEACLVSHALGSCIAVAMHDPAVRAAGLLHFMLPDSRLDPERARLDPALFADSGIALLVARLRELGSTGRPLAIGLAGGAQMIACHPAAAIGKRNYLAARKVLWRMGLAVQSEWVGGAAARSLGVSVSGRIWVRPAGGPETGG
jgi:chemotaxis protein CheD